MVYRLTGDKYSDTMIYNIAFVYNGAIWLDNERGRVILDTISNAKNPTMEAGDGMLHILLCDDDAIFTEALKRLIEAQPEFNRRYMQIECVHDPHALKKAAVQKADMIFLDIDVYNNMKYRQELMDNEQKKKKTVVNTFRRKTNLNMSATESLKRLTGTAAEPQQEVGF